VPVLEGLADDGAAAGGPAGGGLPGRDGRLEIGSLRGACQDE
jgi:hypothetical protein